VARISARPRRLSASTSQVAEPHGRAIERGRAELDVVRWELFKIKTGNHLLYKPVPGNHVPTKEDTSASALLSYYIEEYRKAKAGSK